MGKKKEEMAAPSGNRTPVGSMATIHDTTTLIVQGANIFFEDTGGLSTLAFEPSRVDEFFRILFSYESYSKTCIFVPDREF